MLKKIGIVIFSLLIVFAIYAYSINNNLDTITKNCETGDVNQCIEASNIFYNNNDIEVSNYFAIKACELEDWISCSNVATYYLRLKNTKEYIRYFKLSCNGGYYKACYNLGIHYEIFQIDNEKAKYYHLKACNAGNGMACMNIGYIYQQKEDLINAIKYSKLGCKSSLDSCSNTGNLYIYLKKYKKAVEYFKIACDKNHFLSCNELGALYQFKISSPESINNSFKYYSKACNGNNYISCYNLGKVYDKQKNYIKALELYEKSCNGGNLYACNFAGYYYYFNGYKTIPYNENKALILFKKGCEGDFAISCIGAGDILRNKNIRISLIYLKKACELGNKDGCTIFNKLNK